MLAAKRRGQLPAGVFKCKVTFHGDRIGRADGLEFSNRPSPMTLARFINENLDSMHDAR